MSKQEKKKGSTNGMGTEFPVPGASSEVGLLNKDYYYWSLDSTENCKLLHLGCHDIIESKFILF